MSVVQERLSGVRRDWMLATAYVRCDLTLDDQADFAESLCRSLGAQTRADVHYQNTDESGGPMVTVRINGAEMPVVIQALEELEPKRIVIWDAGGMHEWSYKDEERDEVKADQ